MLNWDVYICKLQTATTDDHQTWCRRKRKRLLQTCLTSSPWLTGKRKPWRSRFYVFRVASGVRKIIDHQFFPPYYRLIIDFSILYRLLLSTFLKIFQCNVRRCTVLQHNWNTPAIFFSFLCMTSLMIRAHVSHCLQSSLLSMVHLDGYVQRILKTQKIID